jgi:hypothetical protein
MFRVTPVLVLLILCTPAVAAEKAGAPGTNVDMPFLMAPMTGADGKLSGYAYISTRLAATSDVNALAVRDKIAFIQDAFVRDINTVSVAKPDDPTTVDGPALQARLVADASKVMGAGKVAAITIVSVQIAALHPTQAPAAAPAPVAPPPAADSAAKPATLAKSGA